MYNKNIALGEMVMKKIFFSIIAIISVINTSSAYQVLSTKEFGRDDAKNQNIVVKCTTDMGKMSTETCSLRRYVKCTTNANKEKFCNSWQPWRDLRNTTATYTDWQSAASACCRAKGLR